MNPMHSLIFLSSQAYSGLNRERYYPNKIANGTSARLNEDGKAQ